MSRSYSSAFLLKGEYTTSDEYNKVLFDGLLENNSSNEDRYRARDRNEPARRQIGILFFDLFKTGIS